MINSNRGHLREICARTEGGGTCPEVSKIGVPRSKISKKKKKVLAGLLSLKWLGSPPSVSFLSYYKRTVANYPPPFPAFKRLAHFLWWKRYTKNMKHAVYIKSYNYQSLIYRCPLVRNSVFDPELDLDPVGSSMFWLFGFGSGLSLLILENFMQFALKNWSNSSFISYIYSRKFFFNWSSSMYIGTLVKSFFN
jgi:hypothetical protein